MSARAIVKPIDSTRSLGIRIYEKPQDAKGRFFGASILFT